jgi:hypothetical protein
MKIGRLSSAVLMLSGAAGLIAPDKVGAALELTATSQRGVAEIRAGLGGTYAALGAWALVSPEPAIESAVGAVWLGAAAARLASLALDRPRTSWSFWTYLGVEVGLGVTAVMSARRPRTSDTRFRSASISSSRSA